MMGSREQIIVTCKLRARKDTYFASHLMDLRPALYVKNRNKISGGCDDEEIISYRFGATGRSVAGFPIRVRRWLVTGLTHG